jgi:hypothetical protein
MAWEEPMMNFTAIPFHTSTTPAPLAPAFWLRTRGDVYYSWFASSDLEPFPTVRRCSPS